MNSNNLLAINYLDLDKGNLCHKLKIMESALVKVLRCGLKAAKHLQLKYAKGDAKHIEDSNAVKELLHYPESFVVSIQERIMDFASSEGNLPRNSSDWLNVSTHFTDAEKEQKNKYVKVHPVDHEDLDECTPELIDSIYGREYVDLSGSKKEKIVMKETIIEEEDSKRTRSKLEVSVTGEMSKYIMNLTVEVSSSSSSQETSDLNSCFGLDPNKEKYLFSGVRKPVELEQEGHKTSSLPEHLIATTQKADEWRGAAVVNLTDKNDLSLVEEPDCPNLVLFFLQRNSRLTRIPPLFFNQMPALCFLDFSETRIRALPSSLFKLPNLEVLMLRSCVCLESLPGKVKNLTKMKVLDLSGTDLYEVPKEIGEVKALRLFHVQLYQPDYGSGYARLPVKLISPGTINTLQALESLSIVVHPEDQRWKDIADDIIKHVGTLEKLRYLHFYFPTVEALQTFTEMSPSWKDQRLRRFNFIVGEDIKRIISRVPSGVQSKYNQYEKCLRFVNGSEVVEVMKTTLRHATAFYLDHHLEATSISDFGISNLKELRFCVVRECPKLESVITRDQETSESALPNLEYLGLHYLWEVKKIWEDPVPLGSFKVLTYLMVANCRKLEYIASHSVLKCLSSLKTLIIEDCKSLKSIAEDNERVTQHDDDDDGNDALLPQLTELVLRHLPQLATLGRGMFPSEKIVTTQYCPNFDPRGRAPKKPST